MIVGLGPGIAPSWSMKVIRSLLGMSLLAVGVSVAYVRGRRRASVHGEGAGDAQFDGLDGLSGTSIWANEKFIEYPA